MATPWRRLAKEIELLPSRGRWRFDDDELQSRFGTTTLATLHDRSIGPWLAEAPNRQRALLLTMDAFTDRLGRILRAVSAEGATLQVQGAVEELREVWAGLGLSVEETVEFVSLLREVAALRAVGLTAARLYVNGQDTDAWDELADELDDAGLAEE